jgi:hypothetical protein
MVTGAVFALLVVAHIARMVVESHRLAIEPVYVGITLIAAGLSAWAGTLLWRTRAR